MKDFAELERQEKDALAEMREAYRLNLNENPIVERFNSLTDSEKQLLLLYVHYGCFAYLAKRYRCSPQWLSKRIKKIQMKIL